MVKVVVVNGRPGCGKTTFEEICEELCNSATIVSGFKKNRRLLVDTCSTIDFVKSVAFMCGWDGNKTPENRKFLSDLKKLITDWGDVPFKKIQDRIKTRAASGGNVDWIIFVDCREPNEIQKIKEFFNATTIIIRREEVENENCSNYSDADVFYYNYDLTIYNNSDIIHLEDEARKFIDYMKKEEVPCYVNAD
jgi:hypothetical protein